MRKKFSLLIVLVCVMGGLHQISAANHISKHVELNYKELNRQAEKEYLETIRPGDDEGHPFWNGYAKKFIYAPAFDFKRIEGGVKYRFTTKQKNSVWSFVASQPSASLAPIWNQMPVGQTDLVVEALDKKGNVIGEVGKRSFMRDFPFCGPYHAPVRSYKESALKAAYFFHCMSSVQHWLNSTEPDMSAENNTYACKIIGATVRMECFLAKEMPAVRTDALKIAKNAAQCLMNSAQPANTPLAYFPPTYYKAPDNQSGWPAHVFIINKGKTMFLEAVQAADAYLDLYDATRDKIYLDLACHIADTYRNHQNDDGSWPIKVEISTGKSVDNSFCTPTPLFELIRRLKKNYNVTGYDEMVQKGEQWMRDHALKEFNLTGQFEDQRMEDLKPHQNLTNCTAIEYASYLLAKEKPTAEEIKDATDLVYFSEDQFAHWDILPDENGFKPEATPNVHEQYFYETPVDDSASGVAMAFMWLYERTGNKLCLAKAKALMDEITLVQNPCTGQIPTTWEFNANLWDASRTYWVNCTFLDILQLMRLSQILDK